MVSEDTMGRNKENEKKWRKTNQVRYELYFNRETDKLALEQFEKQANKREYLLRLITEDAKRG